MGGYHAAKLRSYQDVMDVMFEQFNKGGFPLKILNMLNVKYFASKFKLFREGSGFPLTWHEGDDYVYTNTEALPRVFFVDAFRVLPRNEVLARLTANDFDPSREVLLETDPGITPVTKEGSSARIETYNLNAITITAHVAQPCIMVVSEIAYPGWKAEVNGKRKETLTANYCLRALSLSPGDHTIVFTFSSRILKHSLIVSIVTFVLAVAVPLLYARLSERRA